MLGKLYFQDCLIKLLFCITSQARDNHHPIIDMCQILSWSTMWAVLAVWEVNTGIQVIDIFSCKTDIVMNAKNNLIYTDCEDGSDDHSKVQLLVHQAQDSLPYPPWLHLQGSPLLHHHAAGLHLHRGLAGPPLCLLQQHAVWSCLAVSHYICRKVTLDWEILSLISLFIFSSPA